MKSVVCLTSYGDHAEVRRYQPRLDGGMFLSHEGALEGPYTAAHVETFRCLPNPKLVVKRNMFINPAPLKKPPDGWGGKAA